MSRRSFVSKLTMLATVAITLGTLSTSAFAVTVLTTSPLLRGGTVDFGSGSHSFGNPTSSGSGAWDYTTVNGELVATGRIRGTLYWDSLDPGCGRLTIEFQNRFRTPIATRVANVCGPGGNANNRPNQVAVDESFASPNLNFIVLRTNEVRGTQLVGGTSQTDVSPVLSRFNTTINSGTADFGNGAHAAGTPTGQARVELSRQDGTMRATVDGTLYWDALLSQGCARLIIDFQNANGDTITSRTVERCGPGGNANDAGNKRDVSELFTSGSVFRVRLRVGSMAGTNFVNVQTKTFTFN